QAEAQIVQAQAGVSQARSTLNANLVEADNAQSQADRLQSLFKKSGTSAISQQRLDDTQAQARQARARADASRTAVDSAASSVTAAKAGLQAAKAGVEAAKAGVATAQVAVDRLTVEAPIDGQVVQKNVNIGSYVQPGTQMMAIVPKDLYVTANYKETQLADIRIGQQVDLSVDAFPDVDFKGTVRSIQNGAGQAFQLLPPQNATGNFVKVVQRVPVRISIDEPPPRDRPIGPGMSVVPSIHVD
ncbi:MAG: HlyD family secretion protein, partial [Geminicoccaceae bacterium]|nr:HlyD family secretion protein [Geminicoccaceae bacterium]